MMGIQRQLVGASGKNAKRVALGFLEALRESDFVTLRALLTEDVWFRALLPRGLKEARNADGAIELLKAWYEKAPEWETLETSHHSVEGREFIRYRFRLEPDWVPDQDHVIEQAGFCGVVDGRIRRLDLVCTGFHPIEENASEANGSATRAA